MVLTGRFQKKSYFGCNMKLRGHRVGTQILYR